MTPLAWALSVLIGVAAVRVTTGLRESRRTAVQRLDQLAALPADLPLDSLRRAIPWLDCRPTIPLDSTPFDHRCAGAAGGVAVRAAVLDRRLVQLHLLQMGVGGPNLHVWARRRYGTPSDSCERVSAGFRATVVWWRRGTQTIAIRKTSGSPDFLASEVLLRSDRLGAAPGCDAIVVGPRAPSLASPATAKRRRPALVGAGRHRSSGVRSRHLG